MGHHHDHHHHHHHHHHVDDKNKKLFVWAFGLTFLFSIIELVYGFISRSLALISDSLHMLSDSASLFLGLIAVFISTKVATKKMTFGYKRFETIAAFINGLTLILIPLYVIFMAIQRFIHPETVLSKQMLIVGIVGLLINLVVAFILSRGDKNNLNLKASLLHVLSDLFTSVTVILASLCIMYLGWFWVDPFVSIITSLVIIKGGISVTREAYFILMEGCPKNLDYEKIYSEIEVVPFILKIDDLHLWSLSGDDYFATLKAKVDDDHNIEEIHSIFEKEHIHATIELYK